MSQNLPVAEAVAQQDMGHPPDTEHTPTPATVSFPSELARGVREPFPGFEELSVFSARQVSTGSANRPRSEAVKSQDALGEVHVWKLFLLAAILVAQVQPRQPQSAQGGVVPENGHVPPRRLGGVDARSISFERAPCGEPKLRVESCRWEKCHEPGCGSQEHLWPPELKQLSGKCSQDGHRRFRGRSQEKCSSSSPCCRSQDVLEKSEERATRRIARAWGFPSRSCWATRHFRVAVRGRK